jgi:Icc-related predicted phosphoesterase
MKVALCSDLHLEFGDLVLKNTKKAEVLILGGDICVAKDLMDDGAALAHKSERYHDFFKQVCSEFPHVVYVMGNHEHYNGDFATTHDTLKERLGYLTNLHILEKETFNLGEVTFIGGTLWTDMNDGNDLTISHVASCMNDFRCVKNSNKMYTRKVPLFKRDEEGNLMVDEKGYGIPGGFKFKEYVSTLSPIDVIEEFKKMVDYVGQVVQNNPEGKFVVVGHHAPSKKSTHPRYKHDTLMNGGYSSNLDFFIEDHPQIKAWTHGHTHELFDYKVGQTRVVCNPRGYIGYEERADKFKLKYFEV